MELHTEKIGDELFRVSMYWRIGYGSLRVLLSLLLFKLVGMPFSDILYTVMHHELIADSSDFLFQTINSFFLVHPFSVTYFLAFYLLFWGLIDIGLSISLLRHKIWAFPVSLILIGLFILYGCYRFVHTDSLMLLSIIIIDTIIFYLIKREYTKMLEIRKAKMATYSA